MFAFIDLRTSMFLAKEPDDKDTLKQRTALEKQLPRIAAAHPEAVVSVIHTDDASEKVLWRSELVFGPKGGAAVIAQGTEGMRTFADVADAVKDNSKELKRKLQDLQNKFTSDCAALYAEHDRTLLAMLRAKPSKASGAQVTEAGYGTDGKWLDVGPLPKRR